MIAMGNIFAFEHAVNLAELLGDNFVVETLYDQAAYIHKSDRAVIVLERQAVINSITQDLSAMAGDVARFAQVEEQHDDAVMIGMSISELAEALDRVRKSTAPWFYILP